MVAREIEEVTMETNSQSEEYTTIDLMKVLFLLKEHFLQILAATLAGAAIGFVLSAFVIAPTYSASADMLVNNNQDGNAVTTITTSDLTASSNLVNTYSIILKSHDVLQQVIQNLKLDDTYEELEKRVTVEAVDNSQVMRITVKDGDAATAMKIVNEIVTFAPDAIINTVEAGSVKTVDNPWTTGKPVAPSKRNYTAIAALLGLMISAGIVLLKDMLNDTFKTEEDIRKILDLPVLGIIPLEDESAAQSEKKGA